jgi:diguanylate cyclase (GGDEF)-like protein
LLLGGLINIWLSTTFYQNSIQQIARQSIKTANETFINLEDNDIKMLKGCSAALLNNPRLEQAFLSGDREQLYTQTRTIYSALNSSIGLWQWNFIDTDNKVFLRVQQKEVYGDAISRVSYLESVKSKDFGTGLELGLTGFSLRVVHPFYDDSGKLIGYMELGEEINHFLSDMKKQTGDDYGLLLQKKYLDEKTWDSTAKTLGIRNNWNDMKDVLLVYNTTANNDIVQYNGDIENVPDGGSVLAEIKQGNSYFIRGVFPIYDASQKKAGVIFLMHDITASYQAMKAMQQKTIIIDVLLMIILSLIIILVLNSLIFARLNTVMKQVTRTVGGDYTTRIEVNSKDEVGLFEALFEQFRIIFINTMERLQLMSRSDGLTGIANRRLFDERLHSEWRRAARDARPLSLIMCDVDYFKEYNDAYGHLLGDDCLKQVANVLNDAAKRAGDLAARYGGDEFAVILPDIETEGAALLAEETRSGVEKLRIENNNSPFMNVTISAGVATLYPSPNASPVDLIAASDKALYAAKKNGHNRAELCSAT